MENLSEKFKSVVGFGRKADENNVVSKRRVLGDITNSYKTLIPKKSNVDKSFTSTAPAISNVSSFEQSLRDRSYMRREIDDIDQDDSAFPDMTKQYLKEMYENFQQDERKYRVNPAFLKNQRQISHENRAVLIDWMVEIHKSFRCLHPGSLFLAVNIVDRFTAICNIRLSRYQLVGIAAFFMATKYEELYFPTMDQMIGVCRGTDHTDPYHASEIVAMESQIIAAIQYHLTVPTAYTFVCRFLSASHADKSMCVLASYLCERSLQEYEMQQFLPSLIAAAAVRVSRKTFKRFPWSPTLLHYTGYDEDELMPCVEMMSKLFSNVRNSLRNVQKSYARKYAKIVMMDIDYTF